MSVSYNEHVHAARERQAAAVAAPVPVEEIVPDTDFSTLEYLTIITTNGMMFQISADPKAIATAVREFHRGESFAIETRDGRILHYRNAQIISLGQQNQLHVDQENQARQEHETKMRLGLAR